MNRKVLRTAIIICWVVLAVCFVIKIFGGRYFEIATNNETFKAVCDYVDNHLWLQYILSFITSLITAILLNLAVLRQKWLNAKQSIILLICVAISFTTIILRDYIQSQLLDIIAFAVSIVPLLICPMIFSKKPLRSIIAVALYLAFQGISIVVKGLSISKINDDSALIGLIFSIDLYIMLILYYLYSNFRKDNKMNKINEKGENDNG